MVAGYRVGMHFLTSALRLLEPRVDDDLIDRLHYLYSSTIILMFALLVSAKQYVGHPIECFVPAQFTRAMEQYTENYCWVQNTYWVPFQDLIPHRLDDRERRQIGYYQWVPFVLALAALMFYMPATVWRTMAAQSGLNVSLVLQLACQDQNLDPLIRDRNVDVIVRHVDDALKYQRDFGSKQKQSFPAASLRLGKYYGAYVAFIYLTVKSLHLSNVILQFILLNSFLETSDYPLFGGHVLYDLLMAREWRDSGKFPRVTLCDFEIRVLGNVHRHTVQCVLVINMFTEKIFIFLWLWMLVLAISTGINLFAWAMSLSMPSYKHAFIEKILGTESEDLSKFVDKYLRTDGIFTMQMLSSHAGSLMCTCVVQALWRRFLKQSGKLPPTVVAAEHEDDKEHRHQQWESVGHQRTSESVPKFPISTHYV